MVNLYQVEISYGAAHFRAKTSGYVAAESQEEAIKEAQATFRRYAGEGRDAPQAYTFKVTQCAANGALPRGVRS